MLRAIDQAIDLGRQIEPSKIQSNREPPCPEDELRNEITFSGIVGKGAALRRLMKQIDMVASIDSTVLILGETLEPGKEGDCSGYSRAQPAERQTLGSG